MTACDEIISFLNTYLNVGNISDSSQNGLQVQGRKEVSKIVFGVSAGLELFQRAAAAKANLIVVHHGLLWGKEQRLVGLFRNRVACLIENDMNLAGYHLPLDLHPVVGHNACLLKALGVKDLSAFAAYHGVEIGYKGELDASLADIVRTLETVCQTNAVTLPYGPDRIRRVGVVSGGGWSMLPQAIEAGLDLYITGSLEEPVQEMCREGRINCVSLGHYNSEKIGVLALMELVRKQFDAEVEFIDVKNPI